MNLVPEPPLPRVGISMTMNMRHKGGDLWTLRTVSSTRFVDDLPVRSMAAAGCNGRPAQEFDEVPYPPSLRQWHMEEVGALVCHPPLRPGKGFSGPVFFTTGVMIDFA